MIPKDTYVKVWSSPYVRCIQTAFQANLSDQIHIDEQLCEYQAAGWYNCNASTDLLMVNKYAQNQEFSQKWLYRFNDSHTVNLLYPVQNGDKSAYKMEYPEGGKDIEWPDIINTVNQRYVRFYHQTAFKDPCPIQVIFSHANQSQALTIAIYRKPEQINGWYDYIGLNFCCVSIFSMGNSQKEALNGVTFPDFKLKDGIEEILFGYGEHIGLSNTEVAKESDKMY